MPSGTVVLRSGGSFSIRAGRISSSLCRRATAAAWTRGRGVESPLGGAEPLRGRTLSSELVLSRALFESEVLPADVGRRRGRRRVRRPRFSPLLASVHHLVRRSLDPSLAKHQVAAHGRGARARDVTQPSRWGPSHFKHSDGMLLCLYARIVYCRPASGDFARSSEAMEREETPS